MPARCGHQSSLREVAPAYADPPGGQALNPYAMRVFQVGKQPLPVIERFVGVRYHLDELPLLDMRRSDCQLYAVSEALEGARR